MAERDSRDELLGLGGFRPVVDDDDLERLVVLILERGQAQSQSVGTVAGGDDHAHQRPLVREPAGDQLRRTIGLVEERSDELRNALLVDAVVAELDLEHTHRDAAATDERDRALVRPAGRTGCRTQRDGLVGIDVGQESGLEVDVVGAHAHRVARARDAALDVTEGGGGDAEADSPGTRPRLRTAGGDSRAHLTRDCARQGGRDEGPFAREPALAARHLGDRCLRLALGVTAPAEVRARRAGGRNEVVHDRIRLVPHDPAELARRADAQLGLLAARRLRAGTAEIGAEPADTVEHTPTHRHVRPDEVANRSERRAMSFVRAADDPVELGRQPLRATVLEARDDPPTDTEHILVGVGTEQAHRPIARRFGVVVEERDDITGRDPHTGVTRAGEAGLIVVPEDQQVGVVLTQARLERGIVIDDHDQLVNRLRLAPHRGNRRAQELPSVFGVTAHHDRQCEH